MFLSKIDHDDFCFRPYIFYILQFIDPVGFDQVSFLVKVLDQERDICFLGNPALDQ